MPKGLEVLPKSQSVATMLRNVVTFLSLEVKEEREEKGPLSQTQISNNIHVCVVSSAKIDPDEAAQSLFELAKYRKMLAKDRKGPPYPVQVEDGLSFDVYHNFKPAECHAIRNPPTSSPKPTRRPCGFPCHRIKPGPLSMAKQVAISRLLTSPVSEADNANANAAKSLEIATCLLKGCRTRDKAHAAFLLEPISYYFNITLRNIRSSPFPSIHSIRVNEVND
ncbi:hypothetical protein HDU98_006099, partial [Podochytrium sp. JEL0797]